MRVPVLAGIAAALCAALATAVRAEPSGGPGIAAGEVSDTRAVLWARCDRAGTARFSVRAGRGKPLAAAAPAAAADDFTAQVLIEGLRPETAYAYRIVCEPGGARSEGRFATAPPPGARRGVRFAWGGDLGGQNVCRDAAGGYFVFDAIARQGPAFFVALGDMVYADDPCRPAGLYGNRQVPGPPAPAGDLAGFHAAWRYNRADPAFRRFLARHPVFAVWDDHEVTNDFGPHHDSGQFTDGRRLLPAGLAAFLDYNPLRPVAGPDRRLYRTARWGRHLELFLLDTRQYRDPNGAPDEPGRGKSMLGAAQRAWLERALVASDATWRVIVSSVPLSVPTGGGTRPPDGWANGGRTGGFAGELRQVLEILRAHDMHNVVWISADIHFAAVFRLRPFPDVPDLITHEVETGPLNAGVFPRPDVDRTFGAEPLFRYPEAPPPPAFEAAARGFNFGVMRIDPSGDAAIDIVTAAGRRLFTLHLPRRGR